MNNETQNKSQLLVTLAGLPEGDPRLEAAASVLAGHPETKPPSLRLLKMGQAAKETGLSRTTLWRAMREGLLTSVEIRRGSHRISETELQRFCAGL